jgi:ADP-ribose pyrophosphatase
MTDEQDPDFTETRVSGRLAYDGMLLKLHEDTVRLPDGKLTRREWISHPGAVVMIPLLDANTVLLERQFRYPLQRHFLELPAGKIEPAEAPLATAQRELREECGYEAANWRHLVTLHSCIGYSNEHMEFFLAQDLRQVGRELDEGEFLEVVPMTVAGALAQIASGGITDIKTVAGLLWLQSTAVTQPPASR